MSSTQLAYCTKRIKNNNYIAWFIESVCSENHPRSWHLRNTVKTWTWMSTRAKSVPNPYFCTNTSPSGGIKKHYIMFSQPVPSSCKPVLYPVVIGNSFWVVYITFPRRMFGRSFLTCCMFFCKTCLKTQKWLLLLLLLLYFLNPSDVYKVETLRST